MYCYICSKVIKEVFYVMSMNYECDRVFLCCDNKSCIKNIEDGTFIQKVKQI
jgi:hypothetical protein